MPTNHHQREQSDFINLSIINSYYINNVAYKQLLIFINGFFIKHSKTLTWFFLYWYSYVWALCNHSYAWNLHITKKYVFCCFVNSNTKIDMLWVFLRYFRALTTIIWFWKKKYFWYATVLIIKDNIPYSHYIPNEIMHGKQVKKNVRMFGIWQRMLEKDRGKRSAMEMVLHPKIRGWSL